MVRLKTIATADLGVPTSLAAAKPDTKTAKRALKINKKILHCLRRQVLHECIAIS
jgi:hypothetical protein